MTGLAALDWAALAVSLFNTILLLWLGLTVFLNAERRAWGVWLAGGGLLLGAVFFISHTAILGHGIRALTPGVNFWWQLGWIPVTALPLAWYVMMLWYGGYWEGGQRALYRRQCWWFRFTILIGLALVGLLWFANPFPSFLQLAQFDLAATPAIGGLPLLIIVYPIYIVLCIGLSLDALRHPQPSGRLMGDLARRRARRWLVAASLALLAVSLFVGWVMVWVVEDIQRGELTPAITLAVGWFDLVIEVFIGTAVLLLGQAVVTYEVFTGKILPSRGLAQYWRRAIVLALGYSALVAGSLNLQMHPIYSLLLSAGLMVCFYALLGWRAYAERARLIASLRPFVASQDLYAHILGRHAVPAAAEAEAGYAAFQALCRQVLEARQAGLTALGALAPLSGPAWVYPHDAGLVLPPLGAITAEFRSPEQIGIQLEPGSHAGMVFAVPLWSERGLVGLLLLGEKTSGGLYTQEEIEIARAAGERLIDTQASLEMARRLLGLQRTRLAQNQVLDQRPRRVLHDEVLPLVHTALLQVAGQNAASEAGQAETVAVLGEIHRRLSDLLRALPAAPAEEVHRLGLLAALRQSITAELPGAFDEIHWQLAPEAESDLKALPALAAEVLFFAAREAVRNASRHGRRGGPGRAEPFCLTLECQTRPDVRLMVVDNGLGFDAAAGSEDSRGQGLALHSTLLAVIGGALTVESVPLQYTRVALSLPRQGWADWQD